MGEDSGLLKFSIGLALVAIGGIFAFRFFNGRSCLRKKKNCIECNFFQVDE